MKKLILFIVILIFLTPPLITAKADGERISRIMTSGVILYIDQSLTVEWFELPVGYYLKVLSISHTSVKVEYKSDNPAKPSCKGYIATEHLNLVDETPPILFPSLKLTVNQNCMLYKDVDFTISETVTQNSAVDFYGLIEKGDGNTYIYGFITTTSGDKYIGYISASAFYNFTPPSLPINDNKESVYESMQSEEYNEVTNQLGNNLQLVIIIAVSAVAISIVYLLFRPTPTKARDQVVTENEFDDD